MYNYHKNSFEKIKTDVKIRILPILIACWSEFRTFKQNRENPGKIGMVGQSVLSTEMPTPGDLKPGDSLIFANPTHPPPNQLTQPPMGNYAAIIQKIATIFQELFKDYIRFSRTTYYEYNFTDCTKMHIPSPF